jgi:hypothetical protein
MPEFREVKSTESVLVKPSFVIPKEVQEVLTWAKKIKKGIEHEVLLDMSFKGLGRLLKKASPKSAKIKVKMIDTDGKVWRVCRLKGRRKEAVKQGALS